MPTLLRTARAVALWHPSRWAKRKEEGKGKGEQKTASIPWHAEKTFQHCVLLMIHVGVQRVIAVAAARADMMQEAVLNDDGIFFLAARRVVEWSGDGCEHTRSAGTTPNTRVYCLMIHTKESERVRDTREDREHQIQANPCGTHFPSGKKKLEENVQRPPGVSNSPPAGLQSAHRANSPSIASAQQ